MKENPYLKTNRKVWNTLLKRWDSFPYTSSDYINMRWLREWKAMQRRGRIQRRGRPRIYTWIKWYAENG